MSNWERCKKKKYVVVANYGGMLWKVVIETRLWDGMYSDKEGYFVWHKDVERRGYFVKSFDNPEDAAIFLEGAKFYERFIQNLISGEKDG